MSRPKTRSRTRPKARKVPDQIVECEITKLSHEGRGIAKYKGKTQFVENALVGETVKAKYISQNSRYDELKAVEILVPSAQRVAAKCQHFDRCGGCSTQHLSAEAQLSYKQLTLAEQLEHFGGLQPAHWQAPITAAHYGYRRRARLGLRYIAKTGQLIMGFREKSSRQLCDISACPVLEPRLERLLPALRALLATLNHASAISHIELAAGDDSLALVFRHTADLAESDYQSLRAFAREQSQGSEQLAVYLQPNEPASMHKLWPESGAERLFYHLTVPSADKPLRLAFHPSDFTQVNAAINQQMITQALDWLSVQANERVLDLFCGLGNFSLPLALQASELVGVEGSQAMVQRAEQNAKANGIENAQFYAANLQSDFSKSKWAKQGFDKILIDPPRSGALDVVKYLSKFKAKKVVYVSCNPATLARDAGALLSAGYRLSQAGVMDMFAQTTHLESIALFER